MLKQRIAAVGALLAVCFALGLILGFFVPRIAGLTSKPAVYSTAAVIQQVQTLSQLVTIKYVIEKVQILEDPPQNLLRQFLPDNTRVILVAHGIVKAGIDLSQIQPGDVTVSGKKITLKLPRPQITDAYLDEKRTQIIEHNTGFLRSFNKDLEQKTRMNALDDIRRAARDDGILKEAEDRARKQLTALFTQLGFEQVELQQAQ